MTIERLGRDSGRLRVQARQDVASAEMVIPRVDAGDFSVTVTVGVTSRENIVDSLAPPNAGIIIQGLDEAGLPVADQQILLGFNLSPTGFSGRVEIDGDRLNFTPGLSGANHGRLRLTQEGNELIFELSRNDEELFEFHRVTRRRSQVTSPRQIELYADRLQVGSDAWYDDFESTGNVNGPTETEVLEEIDAAIRLERAAPNGLGGDPPLIRDAKRLLRRAVRRVQAARRLIRMGRNRDNFQPSTEHRAAFSNLGRARPTDVEAIVALDDPLASLVFAEALVLIALIDKERASLQMRGMSTELLDKHVASIGCKSDQD